MARICGNRSRWSPIGSTHAKLVGDLAQRRDVRRQVAPQAGAQRLDRGGDRHRGDAVLAELGPGPRSSAGRRLVDVDGLEDGMLVACEWRGGRAYRTPELALVQTRTPARHGAEPPQGPADRLPRRVPLLPPPQHRRGLET